MKVSFPKFISLLVTSSQNVTEERRDRRNGIRQLKCSLNFALYLPKNSPIHLVTLPLCWQFDIERNAVQSSFTQVHGLLDGWIVVELKLNKVKVETCLLSPSLSRGWESGHTFSGKSASFNHTGKGRVFEES